MMNKLPMCFFRLMNYFLSQILNNSEKKKRKSQKIGEPF